MTKRETRTRHRDRTGAAPGGVVDTSVGRSRRSLGRTVGTWAFGVLAGILILATAAAGILAFTIQRSFPQQDGQLTAAGLAEEVTVQRDARGVPTITAGSPADLFFAQGYVHAQDRFWEMDFRRHITSGRLSELFGPSQIDTDAFVRTLGWRVVAEQEMQALDAESLAVYQAYADGVNAYLDTHEGADASFEYAVLGLQNADYEIEPWTPADSVAWLKAMAWDLRSNVGDETARALDLGLKGLSADTVTELYPDYPYDENPVIVPMITPAESLPTPAVSEPAAGPAASEPAVEASETPVPEAGAAPAVVTWARSSSMIDAVSDLLGAPGEGIGSNSWVVSGKLTESGLPLLANDPHLGPSLPSVWHQVSLKCRSVSTDCGFDVSGFSFSGVPGVIIGHNDRIAWGFTNLYADVTDLYIEKVDGDKYWSQGKLVPLEVRTETISVTGGKDVELTVRSTTHGPIVSEVSSDFTALAADPIIGTGDSGDPPRDDLTGEYAVSLAWTALRPGNTSQAIIAMNLADDFTSFRAAASLFDVPSQNLLYADIDGNIGYQAPGLIPIRGTADGSMPQAGWDAANNWQGFIPFDELPVSYNPTSGYIVTANNAVVAPDYPQLLTTDWSYGWRAARIVDLIERTIAEGPVSADDLRSIQADNQFFMGIQLSAAYADVRTGETGPDEAIELLRSWDAQNTPESSAAAYANVLWDELVHNLFVHGRDTPVQPPQLDQDRLFLVVDRLLDDPDSSWWRNSEIGVSDQREMLQQTAKDAYHRLAQLQGSQLARWNWGSLHALSLRSAAFGESGITAVEFLFNRGPYPVGGGASIINATSWQLGEGFATTFVPSMRMVVDLSDLDASTWNQLTGQSGHAYHPNYVDQVPAWQRAEQHPWPFSAAAVTDAAVHTLTLVPAG